MSYRDEIIEVAAKAIMDLNELDAYAEAEAALDAILAKMEDLDMAQISAAAEKAKETGAGDFVAIWRAMLAPLKRS